MLGRLRKWMQQFDTKMGYQLIATALIAHMFYKVVLDNYTGGVLNISLFITVCVMFALYFTNKYPNIRSKYVMISFTMYVLYIAYSALTDSESEYVSRGVYEYGFYQMILFVAAFIVSKVSKEKLLKEVVIFCFPFAAVAVLCAFTYTQTPSTPMYGDTAMRIAGIARSPLSLGMLSGIYSLFAFTQVRISGNRWYYIPMATGFLAMIVSGSRGSMVAFAAGFLLYLLLDCISRRGKEAIKIVVIAAVILTILSILFFTSDLHFRNENINTMYLRIKRIVDWNGDAGNVGRLETWKKWLGVFKDNFWIGIGMSRTGSWGPDTMGVTESGVLRHLVELGFVGSMLYYNLICSCLISTLYTLKKEKRRPDYFVFLCISIIVLVLVEEMVLQITEEITVAFFLWWALGSLLGTTQECK